MSGKRTHYEILGVERTATLEEIKRAYKWKAKVYHPDRFGEADKQPAEKEFQCINEVYEVLRDPTTRQEYDLELERQTQRASPSPKPSSSPSPGGQGPRYPTDPLHPSQPRPDMATEFPGWLGLVAILVVVLVLGAVIANQTRPTAPPPARIQPQPTLELPDTLIYNLCEDTKEFAIPNRKIRKAIFFLPPGCEAAINNNKAWVWQNVGSIEEDGCWQFQSLEGLGRPLFISCPNTMTDIPALPARFKMKNLEDKITQVTITFR